MPQQTGPLVCRLRIYPRLQGLVIGAFSEGSNDLHRLVDSLASAREKYVSQTSGYAISSRERSQIVSQIRRRLSTAFVKANSACTINRVANIGPNSKLAAKRREWVMLEDQRMKQERRSNWNAFVRGGGLSLGSAHFFPP